MTTIDNFGRKREPNPLSYASYDETTGYFKATYVSFCDATLYVCAFLDTRQALESPSSVRQRGAGSAEKGPMLIYHKDTDVANWVILPGQPGFSAQNIKVVRTTQTNNLVIGVFDTAASGYE